MLSKDGLKYSSRDKNRSFVVLQVLDFVNNRLDSGSGTAGSLHLDFLTPSTN